MQKKDERFLKINIFLIVFIAGFYGIIKLVGGNVPYAIVTLGCMTATVLCFTFLQIKKFGMYAKGLMIGIFQLGVIFVISFGGTSLTDDYILYLASAMMAGVYFQPSYILVQAGVVNAFLGGTALLASQRFGTPASQTFLCWACLDLAYFILFLLVRRGKEYIGQARDKAQKAGELLDMISRLCDNLNESVSSTYQETVNMTQATDGVRMSGDHLLQSNIEIDNTVDEANKTVQSMFTDVELCVSASAQISQNMDTGNRIVTENDDNMASMTQQLETVDGSIVNLDQSISQLQGVMQKIDAFSKQIEKISQQTNILAINAAIEAAKTGAAGAGFAVVAQEVRTLAAQSKECSDEIDGQIAALHQVVEQAKQQSGQGTQAAAQSQQSLVQLRESYALLKDSLDQVEFSVQSQNNAINNIQSVCSGLLERMRSVDANCKNNKQEASELFEQILNCGESMKRLTQNADGVRLLAEKLAQTR